MIELLFMFSCLPRKKWSCTKRTYFLFNFFICIVCVSNADKFSDFFKPNGDYDSEICSFWRWSKFYVLMLLDGVCTNELNELVWQMYVCLCAHIQWSLDKIQDDIISSDEAVWSHIWFIKVNCVALNFFFRLVGNSVAHYKKQPQTKHTPLWHKSD